MLRESPVASQIYLEEHEKIITLLKPVSKSLFFESIPSNMTNFYARILQNQSLSQDYENLKNQIYFKDSWQYSNQTFD